MVAPRLSRASKSHPCPVCGGDHKCTVAADGLILCGRADGPVPGFRHLGPAQKDPQWHCYRFDDIFLLPRNTAHVPPKPAPRTDFDALSREFEANMTAARLTELASRLRLPGCEAHLFAARAGWNPGLGCWTFPERDGEGYVIGLATRYPDGKKLAMADGKRGITFVNGWADLKGPVFLVEGASDTVALAYCGLSALGRPSNKAGVEHLAGLLAGTDAARPVVVVGENDRKADGSWPGRDGALFVATELAKRLGKPVSVALPPADYKDVRDWVADRLAGLAENPDPTPIGRDVAHDLTLNAVAVDPAEKPKMRSFANFPTPVKFSDLPLPGADGVSWVLEGLLARDAVTLLSALPKCGKTTLISHLLAALPAGGSFCGKALAPGKAFVVSEEPAGVWAARVAGLGITEVRGFTRGLAPRGTQAEWQNFLAGIDAYLSGDPADLIVFDTLANLWPVKDENSAAEVGAALAPLHQLCRSGSGRSVLLVHHLRKSDGGEGTGSRGSGALAGFVDVILELRRAKPDPTGRRRTLTGYGRYDAIPAEWVIELTEKDGKPTFEHRAGCDDGGKADLAGRIDAVLPEGPPGKTLDEIVAELAESGAVVEAKDVQSCLRSGKKRRWLKERMKDRQGGPYGYWRDDEG